MDESTVDLISVRVEADDLESRVLKGDIVVVQKRKHYANGDLVMWGERSMKGTQLSLYRRVNDVRIELTPYHRRWALNREADSIDIVGKVIIIIRKGEIDEAASDD